MAGLKTEEELLTFHKRELKELQGKIQNLKHGVPKGDKKRKKEVAAEIAILEAQLAEKHERELKELREELSSGKQEEAAVNSEEQQSENVNGPTADSTAPVSTETELQPKPRVTKAQKRRNKKAGKAKEREEAIMQQEADNLSGSRHLEMEKLSAKLTERGLAIHEVPSDGDCLYKAIEHQLSTVKLQDTTVKQLRQETSDYMLCHEEEFKPFLVDAESGDIMSEGQYTAYCKDIATKPAWGGHVEIQALSHVCESPIEVIQADGPSVTAGESYKSSKLILSYHRHMYGLGEHYNSVVAIDKTDSKKEEF